MVDVAQVPVDGRRARRERSRAAVIDAVFELVSDGKVPPTVDQLAERSGVSVSSIFRMFDGLDDMRSQAFEQFESRYAHLLELEIDSTDDRAERIDRFVRARVELCAVAGSLLGLARHRAIDHDLVAARVATFRARLAQQTTRCFRVETRQLTPAAAANLIALLDATASPEAFDLLGAAHSRTPRQIEASWRRAINAVVEEWCAVADAPPSRRRNRP